MEAKLFSALAIGLIFGVIGILAGRQSSKSRVALIRWGFICGLGFLSVALIACSVSGQSLVQEFAARRSWTSFSLSITLGAFVLLLFHLVTGKNDD